MVIFVLKPAVMQVLQVLPEHLDHLDRQDYQDHQALLEHQVQLQKEH